MLKTFFFPVIVLVIPLFFLFVFINSSRNRLAILRKNYRNTAVKLLEEWAARRSFIPKLLEALSKALPEGASSLTGVRQECATAEDLATTVTGEPADAAILSVLNAVEGALDAALEKLLAVARSSTEVRADAALGDVFDSLASLNERVATARRAWEEAHATRSNACAQFPARYFSHWH